MKHVWASWVHWMNIGEASRSVLDADSYHLTRMSALSQNQLLGNVSPMLSDCLHTSVFIAFTELS